VTGNRGSDRRTLAGAVMEMVSTNASKIVVTHLSVFSALGAPTKA